MKQYDRTSFLHTVALHLDLLNTIGGGVSETYVKLEKGPDEAVIRVWAAGVTPETFKVTLRSNKLTINSTLKSVQQPNVSVPMFSRTFILPAGINQTGIEAIYKEGELLINLPYYESADRPREINIKEI